MRPGRQAADDGSFARSVGVHTARGAALIALAVVLGFVLLNKVDTGPKSPTTQVKTTTPTSPPTTHVAAVTTTTRPPAEVKVLVVNGTAVKGVASTAAVPIRAAGYNVLAPADGTAAAKAARRNTTVYYAAGFELEARTVASYLGLNPTAPVAPMPTTGLPVANTLGAQVLVLVGPDYAAHHGGPTTVAPTTSTTRRL